MICAFAVKAGATPYDTFGVGARAVAMGGAYGAVGGDSAACYYNIAALTEAGPFQIELDYHRADIDIRFNDRRSDIDPDKGFRIGFVLGKTFFSRRFRIGATMYTPDSHFMRFVLPPRTGPIIVRYNNVNHMQAAIVGFAGQVFSWWSVGAGATFVSDHVGGVDFRIWEDGPAEGDLKSKLGSEGKIVAGTFFKPWSWLGLGVSYREQHQQKMHLPNKIGMYDLQVFEGNGIILFHDGRLVLDVYSNSHFSPEQYQFAVSVKPSDRLLFAADATHYKYSDMKYNMAYGIAVMEGDFGEVFPTRPPPPVPEPGLEDVWGYAFGAEGAALKLDNFRLDVRGGYNYRETPVPEQTDLTNSVDSDTHIFSAGLGVTFNPFPTVLRKSMSFDVFEQYHYISPRIMHKDDPTNDAGDYEYKGTINSMGASWTIRF